jgi:hypothetical protein
VKYSLRGQYRGDSGILSSDEQERSLLEKKVVYMECGWAPRMTLAKKTILVAD